jgi:hypothetical protein
MQNAESRTAGFPPRVVFHSSFSIHPSAFSSMSASIGDHQFLRLAGNPEAIKERLVLLARPGVPGVAIWKSGQRGEPFTLRSIVDQANGPAAWSTYLAYCQLIGKDPVDLVWSGMLLTTETTKIAVLDVRQVRLIGLLGAIGGLNAPSHALLECEWNLVPVELPAEE